MTTLAHSRCLNHPDRPARARCPRCRRFFCGECITEHADQVICAHCLTLRDTPERAARRSVFRPLPGLLAAGAGFLLLWFLFYLLGHLLLVTPASFHEGSRWEAAP